MGAQMERLPTVSLPQGPYPPQGSLGLLTSSLRSPKISYSVFHSHPWQLAARRQKRAPKAARSQRHTLCQNPRGTFHGTQAASRAQRAGVMRRSWQELRSSCTASP